VSGGDRDVHEVLAELRSARAAIAKRLATMDRLSSEATSRIYYGESTDRTVVAKVDGNGLLVALDIDPAALRVAHPERIGPEIVAAVSAARAVAADEKAQLTRTAFGHDLATESDTS
jgi:DNA-binding protein YbaB